MTDLHGRDVVRVGEDRGASGGDGRDVGSDIAYNVHPERFVRKAPEALQLPEAVWINPPARKTVGPRPGGQPD
jgi:hypothetical protein